MTRTTVTFTHRGWFGICPVYIGDVDSDAPCVDPIHWVFLPLMIVSEFLFELCFFVMSLAGDERELMWPILLGGKLKRPIVWQADDEEYCE